MLQVICVRVADLELAHHAIDKGYVNETFSTS